MPTIREGNLFKKVIMLFMDHKDACLHIPIVKHHHHILHFVWQHKPYQWKVVSLGLPLAPRALTSLTKPILFFVQCKGFHIFIYLDDILVMTCSKHDCKRAQTFCALHWLVLHYILISQSMDSIPLSLFLFTTILGYRDMYVSSPFDKLRDTADGSFSVPKATHYILSDYVPYGQEHILGQCRCTTQPIVRWHLELHVECLPFSSSFISIFSPFPSTTVSASEMISVATESSHLPIFSP